MGTELVKWGRGWVKWGRDGLCGLGVIGWMG